MSSRVPIIVAVVAVALLAVVLLVMATHKSRLEGRPNSVANCDTPPGLR